MKVVLLTGGSSGIGLSTAILLMQAGYKVYSCSRSGRGTAQKIENGGEIVIVKMDVNNENNVNDIVEKIVTENGSLFAVISNAGNGISGSIEDTANNEVKDQMETNFFGSIKVIKSCIPHFRKQKYGKIVAISSVAGFIPIPYQSIYSCGKAAIAMFMNTLAMELKPFNIQCCTIFPGDTKTEFTETRKKTEMSLSKKSAYYDSYIKSIEKMEKDEINGMSAEYIAKHIVNQINKSKMKSRVIPAFQYKLIYFIEKILPNKLKLNIIRFIYT